MSGKTPEPGGQKRGKTGKESFEEAGADKGGSLVSELLAMLKENKKYWLLPIIILLLIFGLLLIIANPAITPFLYPF